ncbi:hypothetical protein TTHERM_001076853 (macronuclear) [Tetrahymena thermophila SB210]|uniref:Uncharacterized protein n=1 Tax=Tetrahymena thermophila (strain SB210) TaxID=312017 RepID=W7XA13_TETTS|nr:hypothetical protein TTHERM_001076853 [Tetrahymena thermophila SB210]EWS74172.1 hypothetical protein TTHERM_001076853 [Tetrahymena thermophila SB210]|eukprot:XP_012653293.1 hypothetical protein TTHERM_001076853 [Tetrahymena thermophila SB210]
MCIQLSSDIVGIDSDSQKCLFDRDIVKQVNKCFDIEKNGKSNVCKNKQNTMCIKITEDIQDQYIGIYKDAQMNLICIEKQDVTDQLKIDIPLILINLKFEYCLKDDFSLDEFYQKPNSMKCSCKYQYCLSNDICIPMDSNQNAARDINQNCAQLNQEGQIQSCFSDKSVCLLKNSITQINKCTTYESIDDVIGVAFINQTNECIFKDKYADLIINKNLVFLKNPYCLFESSHILQVGDLNNNIVGRTQQYLCAKENEVFSDDDNLIEMCIFGFCISKYSCVQMDDFENISKKNDNSCSTNSETEFIECFYSPEEKSTCILEDNGQKSCELMTIENPKTFGAIYKKEKNQIGTCISQDVRILKQSLDSQNQKLICSDGSCILQTVEKQCHNRRILKDGGGGSGGGGGGQQVCEDIYYVQCTKMTYTGITSTQDDDGYCQPSFPSKKCRKAKQCLMDGVCVDMSQDTSLPNFAKEIITTSCLPYQSIQQKGQKIKSCPTGFCIIQVKSNQRYCFQIGTYLEDKQYVGLESLSQRCLAQFEISKIGIDECGDPYYCIFKIPTLSKNQRYLCHSLQLESTQYPGNRVPAKNNLGKCQDLFLPSTISCFEGFYCINYQGQCQPLSINLPIARDVNQKCQPAYTDQSLYCAEGYCLLNQVCLPLSIQNPGREDKTSKCLQEGENGVFGAIQCFQSFCLKSTSDDTQDQYCALIDYKISSQVGRYKQSQKCVKEDDNNNLINNFKIEYCYKGQYCMRKDSQGIQFCSKVLSNDIVCSDVNGACIFSKDPLQKCSSCSYMQCLNQQTQKCVNLGAVYCQDNNGFCSNFQSLAYPYCIVCPKYYCLNKRTQRCTYYKYMYNLQYSQTNCLYQFRYDEECILQDINSVNKYQENLCIDKNYVCLPIAEAQKTKNCLFCPKYYYNPGDGICYQKQNNKNYPYFNLDIQYVSEDCYPKNDCSISNQQCPEGCQKCDNLNMCTQCKEDYFLYQDKQNQNQFCIKCDTNIYSNISQDPILSQYGTQFYKCVECNIQDEDWNLNAWKNKNCAKVVVQIAGIKRFSNNYSKLLYYSIQSGNSQNLDPSQANRQLANLMIQKRQVSPFACSNLCIRCDSIPSKKPYCYRCIDYYYSDQNGICQKCPLNCQKCGRAIFNQNLQPILKDDIPKDDLDQGIYDFSKSIFACIQCNTYYTVSPSFNQCDQCGLYCLECAYEFLGDLVNYRKQNFRNQVYQFLKCVKCKPGYTLSSNRKDCYQIYQLSYCLDQDLNDSKTGLSLRTFLDLSSTSQTLNCLTCKYNSCLYRQSCINFDYYPPRNYVYNCKYKNSYYQITTLNTCINGSPTVYYGGSLSCDFNTECKKQIYKCLECFVSANTYQCKVCSQGYIPSILGCIPCPETCQTCYEEGYINFQRVNFTTYIINTPQTTINFTLYQRLNYQNVFMIKMKCSDCKFGYFLDYTQQHCYKPQCGKYCQNCINYRDSPLCISCNYTKLFNLIAPIQGYISKLHYGTNFLINFQQMVTFDSLQKNCQICPLLCETCEDNNLDLVLDPLSLYQVKCYSCKQQLPSNYGDMQKYEIRYDKARKRCIYCLKNDNGCFFKKKTEIFVECGTASQPLGKGTLEEPLNLYRIKEINLDKLIINDPEFDISLVYYNELQLREIDFTINFIDKSRVCNQDFDLNINTNIKNKIPSIQTLSITLNANQTNSLTDYVMLQNDIATFKGFSSFKIQNMNVKPKNLNNNFGFKIYEEHINNIEFQNTTFLCQRQYSNQLQTYFDNFNGTFIMNNTLFNNCSFYQQTLINVHSDFYPTFITYQLINLSILYSDFSQKSKFVSVSSPSDLEIQDFKFMHGSLKYQSYIMLRKQASIKLNIQIFSAAQITIMQGYTKMNFIQAYNTIQPPINFQIDNFFSTVINLKNVIGKLEIINSRIMNAQNHPNHNLLYIQGSQIQIQNSNFTILANNQQKLQFLSGSNSILGGIAMIQCSALKILSSSFSGGLSLQGGGLYIKAISLANIYIYQTNFTENWSFSLSDLKNSNGGAIYINQIQQNLGATFRFIQCIFSNNFAFSKGGALYVSSSYNKFYLNLLLSNFSNNFSSDGSNLYSSQKNLTNIVQIQQTYNLYSHKYIQDFIQKIKQFVKPLSISPSLYRLQGFNQVYLIQNTFIVEASSIQLNSKENENSFIFQSLIIFDSINYLQLAQNKISNFKVQNYLLKLTNIENLSLSQDQFFDNQQFIYNPNQFISNSLIIIQANSIKLEQIIYINNTCSKCAQGNLQVISNHTLIADSTFKLNTALNGGALSISKYIKDEIMINKLRFLHFNSYQEEYLIRKSNQNQTIYNSTFINNTSLNNGGSIIASNTFLYIIKSKFQENNANQFGGAIVSDLNDKFDQFQKIHLIKNTFQRNKARIGSSFYQMQNLPLHQHFDNKLSQNEAQLYNNNLIQFAVQFLGIKGKQTYRNSLSIDKHLSGKFKDDIVLQLVNNEDQPITTLNEEIKLNVQVLEGKDYYIDQYQISQKSGVFEIKDKINVFGRLGKQIILQISSEYAKSPIYKLDGELTKIETNISFEIEINMAKKCPVGTTYFNDIIKKDLCNPCPQFMYNLNDGDKCYKCPDDFLCQKTSIYLPRGLWRSKNNSYNYIERYGYFQCVGDIDRVEITEKFQDENRYCKEGNIGALCMDCDLYGKYWNERYYQVATYTCLNTSAQYSFASQNCKVYFYANGLFKDIKSISSFENIFQI